MLSKLELNDAPELTTIVVLLRLSTGNPDVLVPEIQTTSPFCIDLLGELFPFTFTVQLGGVCPHTSPPQNIWAQQKIRKTNRNLLLIGENSGWRG